MKELNSKKFQLCIDYLKSGQTEKAREEFFGIEEPKIGSAKSHLYKKLKNKILHRENPNEKLGNSLFTSEVKVVLNELPRESNTSIQHEQFMLDFFSHDAGIEFSISNIDVGSTKNGISIVTACMNREENLLKVLPTWLKTEVSEIIIVDWSSDLPLINKFRNIDDKRIKIIRIENEKKWILTHAFNVGLKFASYKTVFKLDSDIEIKDNFFTLNEFKDGEFIRGFWKLAVDAGITNQKFVNGTFAAKKNDLRQIGYYDERILTYGWDDSDIYYRLTLDHGLLGRLIEPNSIYHVDQLEAQRTAKQEINTNLFLGQYLSTEYEGAKNKYLTINNTTWGNYFQSQDYSFKWKENNYVTGIRTTECVPVPEDLLELSEILSARQLLLWNASSLKNVPYEDQKKVDFARLFSDAHKIGISNLLLSAIKLKKGIHFILVSDEIIGPAINKTVALMRHHVQANKKILVIVEKSGEEISSLDYLVAPRDLIVRLSGLLQAVEYSDVSRFEDRMILGEHTCTLTSVSLDSLCKEASKEALLFSGNLKKIFKPIDAYLNNTCLVTSLYDEYNLIRLIEYFTCFILNINIFEKIIILYESRNNLFYSLISRYIEINNIPPIRIIIIPFNKRPRFNELFNVGNQLKPGFTLAVVNADIVFDGTMSELAHSIKENDFIVLSRRDVLEDGFITRLIRLDNGCPNTFSADAWIVKTPFEPDFYLDYEIGTMHCDSFINFQAGHSKKYNISNPCLDTHIYHLHDERFNSSEEKSIKDKERIEKKYGEEWIRCGNQDPVRGVSWSSLESRSKFNAHQKLQQWRPKALVLNTFEEGFSIGALFLLHTFISLLKDSNDIVIVVRMKLDEVGTTVENLMCEYRKSFNKNFIVEISDCKYDPDWARDKMCYSNSFDFDEISSKLQNLERAQLTTELINHTQWPGIEGIKLVRGDLYLRINDMQHLELFNVLSDKFYPEYMDLLNFLNNLDRWDHAKVGVFPLIESIQSCEIYFDSNIEINIPDVTFITSLYKGGKYLQGYLNNVFTAALFCNGEVIIVDANCDGSESSVINAYLEKNPKFKSICKYIELETDPGLYECWNLAIKESRGRYISNANLDDRRSPFHTKKIIDFMDLNDKFAACAGDIFAVNQGDLMNWFQVRDGQVWFYDLGDFEVSKKDLYVIDGDGNCQSRNIMHCMPVWRRSLHDKFSYFDEEKYGTSADWEFWLRLTNAGEKLFHLSNIFGAYMIDPNSHNRRSTESLEKELVIINDRILNCLIS